MDDTGNGVTGRTQLIMMGNGDKGHGDMLRHVENTFKGRVCGYVGFDPKARCASAGSAQKRSINGKPQIGAGSERCCFFGPCRSESAPASQSQKPGVCHCLSRSHDLRQPHVLRRPMYFAAPMT